MTRSSRSRRSGARSGARTRSRGRRSAVTRKRSSVDRTREMAPVALASCLAAAVLVGLAIVPVRTWLAQQRKMDEARAQLAQIDAEVADLEGRLARLQTDDEIERRARQDFDLVFPGEESYRILPEPSTQQP